MPKKKMWVEWEDGADLSQSRKKPGDYYSPLTRDSERHLGQVVLSDVDDETALPLGSREPELPWGVQLVVDVIEEVVESIDWEAVFEHIVAPAAKRTKARVASRLRSTFKRTSTEIVASDPETSAEPSSQLNTRVDGASLSLSRDEYRQHVFAALAAEAFAARQREILATSRIDRDDVPEELVRAVTLVLGGKTSSLAEDELAAVMDFLEEAQTAAQPFPLPQAHEGGKPDASRPDAPRALVVPDSLKPGFR